MAGPRLIIGEFGNRAVRCLTLSTQRVTTIAGPSGRDEFILHADGPASAARFLSVYGIAVASNGAVFVADQEANVVRRISPIPIASKPMAERVVTTLIGTPPKGGGRVDYSRPAECFRQPPIAQPWAVAFVPTAADESRPAADGDSDVGRLFVGCADGVRPLIWRALNGSIFRSRIQMDQSRDWQ